MNTSGRDWVDELPDDMAGQRALLSRLLAECQGARCGTSGSSPSTRTAARSTSRHDAREAAWRLWAAVLGVPNPQYGLTSILDFAPGRCPAGMEPTVSGFDPASLLASARSPAWQLAAAGEQLPSAQRALLPNAMARFVTDDLASLELADEHS